MSSTLPTRLDLTRANTFDIGMHLLIKAFDFAIIDVRRDSGTRLDYFGTTQVYRGLSCVNTDFKTRLPARTTVLPSHIHQRYTFLYLAFLRIAQSLRLRRAGVA